MTPIRDTAYKYKTFKQLLTNNQPATNVVYLFNGENSLGHTEQRKRVTDAPEPIQIEEPHPHR